MKRTVSMAVLGIAVASSSALAGVYIAPADRAARQQERAAEHREERGRGPSDGGSRGNDRRDERRAEPQAPPRVQPRDERRDPPRDYGRNDRNDHNWSDSRHDGRRDDRGSRDVRPPSHDPRPRGWDDRGRRDANPRGWRDERGRDWHYSRDWYDRYRADHFRYDRGRYLARQRFSIGVYFVPQGYAPRYWQRGQWLPTSYYGERRYHLVDYWRFDLYDPPFGARWVRVGSDALLVDYGSGEVLDVVFELFW